MAMIDWTQVNTLRDEIGRESFDEIIEIFIEEVEQVIDRLRSDPDPETLGDDLHFLKGSALNLGFSEFSDQCQIGESASSKGAAADVDVEGILASYENSKALFMAELPEALNA